MKFISLFSGIGGIDLGLERAGMTCVAQVEIDEFCRRVLAKHWPNVPRFPDVKDYRPARGTADVVAGGFPCQPFSLAGKRGGRDDSRALWPHFARIIDAIRPAWVIAENVPGLRTLGADEVLEDLETLGYACWPLVVGADDVGAPHRRKRVFIVANRQCNGVGLSAGSIGGKAGTVSSARGSKNRKSDEIGAGGSGDVSNAESVGRSRQGERRQSEVAGAGSTGTEQGVEHAASERSERAGVEERRKSMRVRQSQSKGGLNDIGRRLGDRRWPARPGEEQYEWEPSRTVRSHPRQGADLSDEEWPQQPVGCNLDGFPRRLSRWRRAALKALGNSVVPQVAEAIGCTIIAAQREIETNASQD